MADSLKMQTRHALKILIAFTPWVISMFVLYLLETDEIWTIDTANPGKISVAILVAGMGLSFLVKSYFARRKQK